MSCSIVVNQQLSTTGRTTPKTKVKDPERQRRGKKSHEKYMDELKEWLLKDNWKTQMTLKEFIDYFQQDLHDPTSTRIAIKETMCVMKKNTILK